MENNICKKLYKVQKEIGAISKDSTNPFYDSKYIDINSLQANGDQKVIGKDGGTANCHIGQITAAKNGAVIGGRMTCLEEPATGDSDID